MKKIFVLTILLAGAGCNDASSTPTPTPEPDRGTGKADLVGSCEGSTCDGQASDGNCFCDDLCVDFDDCCADKVTVCGGVACGDLGGECLSQPGDPGFPALCESDLGRETLAGGECPGFNEACCGDPIESANACEQAGGECLSQAGDPGFPALCEVELGRETLDADCGAVNLACCGEPIDEPVNECEQAGGECLSQAGDPGFPALCEAELGRETLDADCGALNLACCGEPIDDPPNACEEVGGTCHSQPGDPGFPALCESDLGLEPIDADCGAINLACCGEPIEEPRNECEQAGGTCHSQPGDPGFPALCESDLGLSPIDADCGAFNLACCGEPI